MNKKLQAKNLLILQAVVVVYTFSSVIGKFAAQAADSQKGMLFLLLYGAEIAVLGIYAILWQQMIKKFELSVAYTNRSMALLWSLLWAVLLFGEQITLQKVLGIALVIAGTAVINGGKEKEDDI